MKKVSAGGVELAYAERGSGPAVLLVHGIASDSEAWSPVAEALSPRARVIAYDRRGYGASSAPEPYTSTTVAEQAWDAAALVRALDAAPALACGEDLGALVCLELLLRHPGVLRGAVLVDVPLFAFVESATRALSEERLALEEALRASGPAAAVQAWLGGRGDGARRERAGRRPVAFFADYAGLTSFPVTRRELRGISVPVAIVDTPAAPDHVRAAGNRLAELLPDQRRRDDGDALAALEELLA
ncbi:MAG: hypothetical protein QOI98_1980 [Solirubrobacteraceae bacterium]|nr:hypothetical protein [Solirubrobacteraceae bacterium]